MINECDNKLRVLLIGSAGTPEAAAAHYKMMSGCPYSAACTTCGKLVVSTYVLPNSKRWWIESMAAQPELVGLEKARLVFSDFAEASSPWSRGEVRAERDAPPCKSNCGDCPAYDNYCGGCPYVSPDPATF